MVRGGALSKTTVLRKRWGQAHVLLSAFQDQGGDGGCELEKMRGCWVRKVASLRE